MNVASAPSSSPRQSERFWFSRLMAHVLGRVMLPALLLLFMFWVMISTLPLTSPTYDEFEYITRGYTYGQTAVTTLKLRHPILLDTLAAFSLNSMPDIELPIDHPALAAGNFHDFARVFFWEMNDSRADKMIFLARFMPMMLTLMLVAFVFRWAGQRFGVWGGLLALFLCVFDPNVLAHGRLVTPDVGQAFFMFVSVYAWWRYLEKRGWWRLLFSGVVLGLAQTAGFPALILYPILALITAVTVWPERKWTGIWQRAWALIVASGLSLFVIWAVYGFAWGPVAGSSFSVPAPYHWEEFWDLLQRLDRQDLAYLNGEVYRGGRLAFFPTAILSKMAVPIMIFILLGLWRLLRQRTWRQDMSLWLLPIVYLITAVLGSLNIGYRHLMPMMPFLFVLAGGSLSLLQKKWQRVLSSVLLVWLMVATLFIYPDFLAYFNEWAGGAAGGRQRLVVSDLDWGQDLIGLRDYLSDEGMIEPIYLSYFGTTPPEHYQIRYKPLPAWPQRGLPGQTAYHPDYPLPGTYALSAANLVGARFEENPQTFAWFWLQEPVAKIGHSILVYEVPRLLDETAPAVNVVLSEASLTQLSTSFIEQELHTNDLQARWVNGRDGVILPAERTVIMLGNEDALDEALADRFLVESQPITELDGGGLLFDVDAFSLPTSVQTEAFREDSAGFTAPVLLDLPVELETAVSFLGYEWLTTDQSPSSELKLLSYWQVNEPTDMPLSMFAHLLASDGSLVAQHDGLAVQTEYWHTDDVVVQIHRLTLPETLPTDLVWLALGWYRSDTGARLPISNINADRILIPLPK